MGSSLFLSCGLDYLHNRDSDVEFALPSEPTGDDFMESENLQVSNDEVNLLENVEVDHDLDNDVAATPRNENPDFVESENLPETNEALSHKRSPEFALPLEPTSDDFIVRENLLVTNDDVNRGENDKVDHDLDKDAEAAFRNENPDFVEREALSRKRSLVSTLVYTRKVKRVKGVEHQGGQLKMQNIGSGDHVKLQPLEYLIKSLLPCLKDIHEEQEKEIVSEACAQDFGLYYSCCEDDYKLLYVNVRDRSVYIYSLKSDSWRKLDVPLHRNGTILYRGHWNLSTYLNENLYFLEKHSNERFCSVIRFDTKSEMFSRIETPSVNDYRDTYNCKVAILVISDCVHVCVKYAIKNSSDTYIKLWKLDEYGKMIEVVAYQLVYDDIVRSLFPFHLMKNGIWLMTDWWPSCEHKIYKVDLKKKTQINDKGNIYNEFEYAEVRVDDDDKKNHIIDEEVRYIETFVSPNRYMKKPSAS